MLILTFLIDSSQWLSQKNIAGFVLLMKTLKSGKWKDLPCLPVGRINIVK